MENRQPQSVWTATAEVEFLLVLCSCSNTLERLGKERLGKVQTGTVRYGESVWVTCTIGSSPCHLLFRFSRAPLHFAVSLIGLGNRLARPAKAPLRAQPKSALLNQRSPHHPPTTRPENPSCRRLLTERLPVPQNGTPLRPHRDPISKSRIGFILRIRVSFPCPLVFRSFATIVLVLAVVWPGRIPFPVRFFDDTALGESNRGPPVGATACLPESPSWPGSRLPTASPQQHWRQHRQYRQHRRQHEPAC